MKLIAGWLIAQGVALANCENPSEQTVLEALQKVYGQKQTELVTLGNDKSSLSTTVKTERHRAAVAVCDLAFTQGRLSEADRAAKILALENSTDFDKDAKALLAEKVVVALENDFKAERKARIEAVVDLTISQGKLDVAGRDAKVTELVALDNAKLAEQLTALDKLPVKFKVGATATAAGDRKSEAADTRTATDKVLALANDDTRYKGKPFTPELYAQILKDNPALKEELSQPVK